MSANITVAVERLLRLVLRLQAGDPVTARYIMEEHGTSRATAKRDMTMLERVLPAVRMPVARVPTKTQSRNGKYFSALIIKRTR